MTAPLSTEREQEIRETHPGDWYSGPWTQDYVEGNGDDDPAYYKVVHHDSGTVLATLPDFAGSIALFIADAHDAVPELFAEVVRLRGDIDMLRGQLVAATGGTSAVVERLRQQQERIAELETAVSAERSRALNEGADEVAAACELTTPSGDPSRYDFRQRVALRDMEAMLRRMADVPEPARGHGEDERTPCSVPECNVDGTGEPCTRHEREDAHAEGEHELCGPECEVEMPSDALRNFIIAKGYPGTAGALDELLRRAREQGGAA